MEQSNGDQTLSRKERERIVRQQEILKAARDLFVRKGYHETTLDEIASHAEFGKGTIYNYFSSKEDLFYGILDQTADELFGLIRTALAVPGTTREKFTAYARAIIDNARVNSDLFRLFIQEFHRSSFPDYEKKINHMREKTEVILDLVAQPVEEEIRTGSIKPYDAKQLVSLFDGMLRGYCFNFIQDNILTQSDDVDTLATQIVSVFFDGITEPKFKG